MSKQSILIIIGVVAVVALVMIFVSVRGPDGAPRLVSTGVDSGEQEATATRAPLPRNVILSVLEEEEVQEEVASPEAVGATASHRGGAEIRIFNLKMQNNKFFEGGREISKLSVYNGDTVVFNVEAVDKNYDFTQPDLGMILSIPRGETRRWTGSVHAGEGGGAFFIFCESCGGPELGPKIEWFVVPR